MMSSHRTLSSLIVAAVICALPIPSGVAGAGTPVGAGPTLGDPDPNVYPSALTTSSYIAMGQVRVRALGTNVSDGSELVEGVSNNAVVGVADPSNFETYDPDGSGGPVSPYPLTAEVDLNGGAEQLHGSTADVASGDCQGFLNDGSVGNTLMWRWSKATDALTVTLTRGGSAGNTNYFACTVTYPNFREGLLLAHPNWGPAVSGAQPDVDDRLEMMNAARIVVRSETGYSTTLGGIALDGTATSPSLVAAAPGTTVDKQVSGYDFDAGGEFAISGTIQTTGSVPANCRNNCLVQVSVGHYSQRPTISPGGTTGVIGNEGDSVTASGSFTDADGDPLLITQVSGPGAIVSDPQKGTWGWSWTPTDEATGSVTVRANDGWGNNTEYSFTYTIDNAPPTITSLAGSPNPALVAAPVTWTGSATDPGGSSDPLQWQFGSDPFSSASSFSTSYPTCGTAQITATVRDDFGASDTETSSISVYDGVVLPPLELTAQNLVRRGQVVPVKLWVGCNGGSHLGLAPAIRLRATDTLGVPETAPDTSIPISVSAADTAGEMRPADGFYLYNLQVPDNPAWPVGKELTIEMYPFGTGNPSVVQVVLKLRK